MSLVIKYGGNAMTDPATRGAVSAGVRRLASEGVPPVLVHGGGPNIAAALDARGIEHRFVRGLRVTNDAAMAVVEAVLTVLGKELAGEVGRAVALTGRDAGLLLAERVSEELGRVGRITRVDTAVLAVLRDGGLVPVVASVAVEAAAGSPGVSLNVNADEAAGAIAGALGEGAVFLTNVPGVLENPDSPASLLHELTAASARERIADGRIAGGMIPKVEAALFALEQGAPFAMIADGRHPDGVTRALAGAGTRVFAN